MSSNQPKQRETTSEALHENQATRELRCSAHLTKVETDSAINNTPALSDSSEHLMEQIVSSSIMENAWKKVRSNRGGAGPDGLSIKQYEEQLPQHWPALKRQLLDGSYQPSPARRKAIAKPGGGERLLGIPNVQDRLIQQAILIVLTPWFDPEFSDSSHGFRPNRSAHGAIKQVQSHIQSGSWYVVDMDLSKFFDRVQHDVLMSRLSRKIRDKRLLKLIGRYLRSGVMVDKHFEPSKEGTMQGGPLSPLLANILLDDLDKTLESRGHRFVRYADDFAVFTKTKKSADRVFERLGVYLEGTLKLKVNREKSKVCRTHGFEFLGFEFRGSFGVIHVSRSNVRKLKQKVREITRPRRGVSLDRCLTELRPVLRGWVGYFGISSIKSRFRDLDGWIRRRLRATIWRNWRKPKRRISNLMRLGKVDRLDAVKAGSSGKGAWRLSMVFGVKYALNNAYLRELGLVSLLDIWESLAPKLRTA